MELRAFVPPVVFAAGLSGVLIAGSGRAGGDLDADGLLDSWEVSFGLDPSSATGDDGAAGDPDGDGRSNAQEQEAGSHPRGRYSRYLGGSATGAFFDTRLAIANPGSAPAHILLTFSPSAGAQVARTLTVAPASRTTVLPETLAGLDSADFGVTIESDEPVAADRLTAWDATGYGQHAETSVAGPSTTWFLGAGATHSGFNLFYTFQNPSSSAADVDVRYLLPAGSPAVTKRYQVPANGRVTVWVNADAQADPGLASLVSSDVSAAITSSVPILAERAIYLERQDQLFGGGYSAVGVASPATTWFFAEGATGEFFDMWLTLVNPHAETATVDASYRLASGEVVTTAHSVAGNSRLTVAVDLEDPRLADASVTTALTSTNGVAIVAERTTWWPGSSAATWQEAHNTAGATNGSTTWAIGEGEVGGALGRDTYIVIGSLSAEAGSASVKLLFEDGTTAEKTVALAAMGRLDVRVAQEFPASAGKRFSALVQSLGAAPAPLVVEWTMYSKPDGVTWTAGANALATPLPLAPTVTSPGGAPGTGEPTSPTDGGPGAGDSGEPDNSLSTPAPSVPGAGTYNLRVVTDASPDVTDLRSLVDSMTSRWTSNRDKVWATYYWSRLLKRQTIPMVLQGREVTDPVRNFSDFGFTMCSTIAGINQSLFEAIGLKHEYWDICNHTVSAVEYDGKFRMVDSSMSNLVIGVDGGLASVTEAAADSGRLVKERSLYSTSSNGFLQGSDTLRPLNDVVSPVDGSIIGGFANAFCAAGLKYRDYYYNWDAGHRYVLNVREGESYTRYYRRLGETSDYWVGSESVDGPDPSSTFQIDAEDRFGIRGNGLWTLSPELSPDRWQGAVHSSNNVTAAASGGLRADIGGQPSEVVYKVQGANIIASQKVRAEFTRTDAEAGATISISLNHGITWLPVGSLGTGMGSALPLDVSLRGQVSGAYEVLVRVQFTAPVASPEAVVLTGLTVDTVTQVNTKALPALNVGKNEVYVALGDQTDTMVLWPELRGDFWKRDVFASSNVGSQSTSMPRTYTALVYPAVLTQDAHLTYRLNAPNDITRVVYGGRLHNKVPGSYIDFLHSFDNGATWVRSYRLSDTSKPYDVIHYETVTNVPAGVRTVLFKYLMHNTSTTASSAAGLYAARMEVNHQPLTGSPRPVEVTLRWKEVQADRSLVERGHKQRVTGFPFRYIVNVGGQDHPVMESMRLSVEDPADSTPSGYSDGVDRGGTKFVPMKQKDGINLAKSRPYTFSRTPSGFQNSAPASNTTILTDGVVGAPLSGGYSYWLGQCWGAGAPVDLRVDLGGATSVSAFRAHLFGYPFWDALKGEVQDTIEVLTSADGVSFISRGLLRTALWKKDVPVNYMLLDDGRATAWNFALQLAAPVSARYVMYRMTPTRHLCASELQALDTITSTPFDLRLNRPAAFAAWPVPSDWTPEPEPEPETEPTPDTQSPAVAITSPEAGTTVRGAVSVTAHATDNVGVTKVELLINGTVQGTLTSAPFTFAWDTSMTPPGATSLQARAYDAAGNVSTSALITVTVDNSAPPQNTAPTVTLTSPSGGAGFTAPATIGMAASAADSDGTITSVAFYAGATLVGSDATSPYEASWTDAPAGTHSLTARATDNAGAETTSAPVSVTVAAGPDTPPPTTTWTGQDIGVTGVAGNNSVSKGVFTVQGGGADIWNNADAFRYVWQPLTGDADIVARVVSVENVHAWVKAGVMIRESLGADSAHGLMLVSPGKGLAFQRRVATGGLSTHTTGGAGTAPNWVKLERRGNSLTAYRSANGISWTLVGSDTFAMKADVYIGLAVSSHVHGRLATATFDNVTVTPVGGPEPEPEPTPDTQSPAASITSPQPGATVKGTVSVTASATDNVGVTKVDLLINGALHATATAAPYTFAWDTTQSPAGAATLQVRAYDAAGNIGTSALTSVTVDNAPPPNVAPTVTLTGPTDGASFTVPATIALAASASDSDGTITAVAFYAGATLIGSDSTSPYEASWTDVPAGTYSLTARATDNAGAVTTSSPVTITVAPEPEPEPRPDTQSPAAAITSPQAGTTVRGTVSVTASATDNVGVTKVELMINGALHATSTMAPYTFAWDTTQASAGAVSLQVRAYDAAGNVGTSAPTSVTVDNAPPPNVAPTVTLTGPAGGASFTAPAAIALTATASDSDGTITAVAFYAGATLIGSDSTLPYGANWTDVPAGTYSLTARATDNAGAVTTSSPVTITVTPEPVPPPGLPSPWTASDIGAVGAAGRAEESAGTFTVAGAGADIWGSADAFHYVWRPLSGDADIVARVTSVENLHHSVKAGVMIRDTLASNSTNALMLVTAAKGLAFQRRTQTGGPTRSTSVRQGKAPMWVKLERRGNTIRAFWSTSGATWTLVGSDTISSGADVHVGLAVTSNIAGQLATAVFDNVQVTAR